MPRTEWSSIREYPVIKLTLDTQKRIADYLDRETGEIDAMLAKMDELTETLEARAEEFVARELLAVPSRRGLRWMVDSITTGPFGTQVKQSDYVDDGIPLINPSHIVDGFIRPSTKVAVSRDKADELRRFALAEGDVVVARRGEFGRAAVIRHTDLPALCGTGSLRVSVDKRLALPEFIQLAISSREAIREMALLSVGTTMDNLNERILGEVHIPEMSVAAQQSLLDRVSAVTSTIDAMLAKTAELKALLIERRAALITDVVTGKKQVR